MQNLTEKEMAQIVESFRNYIKIVDWRIAETMKSCPHSYTVRWVRPELDSMFCKFAQFIRDYGYIQKFHGHPGKYFDIDEFKYWTMGSPILPSADCPKDQNTFILNRADKTIIYGEQ